MFVCPSVRLSVRPSRFVSRFGHNLSVTFLSQIYSKLYQIFTRSKVWSPKLFKMFVNPARSRVHAQRVKRCTLLLRPFWGQFFQFFRHFLTKNEKTDGTLQIGIEEAHLFYFIHFFPFQSGTPSKWPKCVIFFEKSTFFAKI